MKTASLHVFRDGCNVAKVFADDGAYRVEVNCQRHCCVYRNTEGEAIEVAKAKLASAVHRLGRFH